MHPLLSRLVLLPQLIALHCMAWHGMAWHDMMACNRWESKQSASKEMELERRESLKKAVRSATHPAYHMT
jgi:hypothetical protein